MFVKNFKLNSKMIFKIIFVILFILIFIMCIFGVAKMLRRKEQTTNPSNNISKGNINVLTTRNYTNVLKTVHSDLDTYVGKKIQFTGFVYRLYDFSNEQFVLGRQMIVSSDMQAVVVGFLCHLNEADKYKDGSWVEIEGTITKGDYHGAIPVIEIESIKEVKTPSDEYVYPPEETYIPTSTTL